MDTDLISEQVTTCDIDRLQSDSRTVDDLIAEERQESRDYRTRQKHNTSYWLNRADRCNIAGRRLKGKKKSTDGKLRTLADYAVSIGETYNTVTLLGKLSTYRAWCESWIEAEELKALDIGRQYEEPHWKNLLKIARENDPRVTPRATVERKEPPEVTRLKELLINRDAQLAKAKDRIDQLEKEAATFNDEMAIRRNVIEQVNGRIKELEAENEVLRAQLAEPVVSVPDDKDRLARNPDIGPEPSDDQISEPDDDGITAEAATGEPAETSATEPEEDHAQANLAAALARTPKVCGPYHLSAERMCDVIYRENEEPESLMWFVEHFTTFHEAVAFTGLLSQESPTFEERETYFRGYRTWDWYDDDAEISWSIWIGQPPTMITAIKTPAPASPREEAERRAPDTGNSQQDELLAMRDWIIKEIDARFGMSDEIDGKLAEEQIERTRIEAERATEFEREAEQRAIFEAAINNAPNNYQKGKARRNLREFEVACAAASRIFMKTMERFDARSVRPPRRVRKNLSMLGLAAFPTVAELNTAYRQQAAALHAKFGSDTAEGYADEFHVIKLARDDLLAILKD
jgi:hypothetical protein